MLIWHTNYQENENMALHVQKFKFADPWFRVDCGYNAEK